jgi:hypothetical protein
MVLGQSLPSIPMQLKQKHMSKAHQEKEKEKDTSKFINELDQILQSGSS